MGPVRSSSQCSPVAAFQGVEVDGQGDRGRADRRRWCRCAATVRRWHPTPRPGGSTRTGCRRRPGVGWRHRSAASTASPVSGSRSPSRRTIPAQVTDALQVRGFPLLGRFGLRQRVVGAVAPVPHRPVAGPADVWSRANPTSIASSRSYSLGCAWAARDRTRALVPDTLAGGHHRTGVGVACSSCCPDATSARASPVVQVGVAAPTTGSTTPARAAGTTRAASPRPPTGPSTPPAGKRPG